ncbi:hypothetical protein KXD40_004885 [Peronospora effusa]|nr:hypothetical protein KXD40_004885 [Peronospora effusa]
MARTRQQQDKSEEWSCPLCTLLNVAEDDRCAACDNSRPLVHQPHKSQSLGPPLATATATDVQHVIRPITGVFFTSLPRDHCTTDVISDWRQEPRLKVNRWRRNGQLNVIIDREREMTSERIETGTREQKADSRGIKRGFRQEKKTMEVVHNEVDTLESMVMREKEMKRREEEETAMEEPCFNLLGSVATAFNAPVTDTIVEAKDEMKSRAESAQLDTDNNVVRGLSPSRYPGFMPASKVHVEEQAIEEKLANAGLDLSDSEEEMKEVSLRQWKEKEDEWVCQICTTLNERAALECSSCSCKRYRDISRETNTETGSPLRWACYICTNLNPSDSTACLMCLSTRKVETEASNTYSDKTWTCSLCTTLNDFGITRCKVCDRLREEGPKSPTRKGRECRVCTNINSPSSTRCEICETSLPTDKTPDNHLVDLSFSSPARKASYTAYQEYAFSLLTSYATDTLHLALNVLCLRLLFSDLENPYVDLSQYNGCDASNEAADFDVLEEISDHERSKLMLMFCVLCLSSRRQPPLSVVNRPPLQKTYVATLVAVSTTTKCSQAKGKLEFLPSVLSTSLTCACTFIGLVSLTPTASLQDKHSPGSGSKMLPVRRQEKRQLLPLEVAKRPAEAVNERQLLHDEIDTFPKSLLLYWSDDSICCDDLGIHSSAGGEKVSRAKRAKKAGFAARPASSATKCSPTINHYDDSAADLGEDLSTMAWEGVGSAGYI